MSNDGVFSFYSKKDLVAKLQDAHVEVMRLQQELGCNTKLKSAVSLASERAVKLKSVDVAFVFDCTSSMSKVIEAAKDKMRQIQQFILSFMGKGCIVRFAFVAYRDYGDAIQFQILPFVHDLKQAITFLTNIEAKGGGDPCEDVVGALEHAVDLQWRATTRVLYLVCDAPSHGRRFHDFYSSGNDLYLDDEKQFAPTDDVFKKMVSQNIHFVGLNYGTHCDKMFKVFHSLHASTEHGLQTLMFSPDASVADFARCVMKATSSSLLSSLSNVGKRFSDSKESGRGRNIHMEIEEVDWSQAATWPFHTVVLTSMSVPNLRGKPQVNTVTRSVRLRPTPFAKGHMRYAFPAFVEDRQFKFVAKAYQFAGEQWQSEKAVQIDVSMQAYSQFFALEFSKRFPNLPLQFVQAQMMTVLNFEEFEHFALEPFISGVYTKYTSNAGYVGPDSAPAQAFSHFTWHLSGGDMMVTDIQGVGVSVLTDPQIHTANPSDFGAGNLGTAGMDRFFLSHTCNDICKQLSLTQSPVQVHPESFWDAEASDAETPHSLGLHNSMPDPGPLQCEGLCGAEVHVSGKDYMREMRRHSGIFCEVCKELIRSTECRKQCQMPDCTTYFTYSVFVVDVTGSARPKFCRACQEFGLQDWSLV